MMIAAALASEYDHGGHDDDDSTIMTNKGETAFLLPVMMVQWW